MTIEPSREAYLRSISMELQSRASRIRHLIGDSHFLTDGHHKEYLLHGVLGRFLPEGVVCSRGFVVRDQNLEFRSKEQDLLIVDVRRSAPLFFESGVLVTFPENVVASISVKSTLDSTNLKDALVGLGSIPRIDSSFQPWLGVFAFNVGETWARSPALALKWLRENQELVSTWKQGVICGDAELFISANSGVPKCYRSELSTSLFIGTVGEVLAGRTPSGSRGVSDLMSGISCEEVSDES